MIEELVDYFDKYMIDNIDLISVVIDTKYLHIEYEKLRRDFVDNYSEDMFMLSENDKHMFDVLSFDKYCKHLESIGL